MQNQRVVITDYEILTAYGLGIENNWQKLLKGETAITKNKRFLTEQFISSFAALIPTLNQNSPKSLVMQMIEEIKAGRKPAIENPDLLILATTVGEIDFLERSILETIDFSKNQVLKSNSKQPVKQIKINTLGYILNEEVEGILKSSTDLLLNNTKKMFNAKKGMLISAACASSSTGIAYAADLIKTGEIQNALIVGCDAVTEFVYSGFSALLALDEQPARPFDKNRNGLTIGEGAAYLFLASEDYVEKNHLPVNGYVSGYGMSNDANHITGPSRDGKGLANAIKKGLTSANLNPPDIGVISAHGTGTVYNDSMEMKAFKSVFDNSIPIYSLKGGLGHTLGAAGIIEIIIAVKSFQENIIPPTVGLIQPDEEAEGWVNKKPETDNMKYCLSVNAGFGGINTAIVIEKSIF